MYQIGEFSKICQVSVKTLRHYDRLGLLEPAEVDRFTGYRYYDRSQLEKMLMIQRLKRYGFSLEEIQSLICCGGDALCEALSRQRERLRWKQQEIGMTIHDLTLYLQKLERTGVIMEIQNKAEIKVLETPPRAVLSCRQRMGVDDFGRYYGVLYERITRDRLTPDGVFGAMYHDKEWNSEDSDTEVFIGIRETEKADRIIAPQSCAMTIHRGGYSTLSETYAALVEWIREQGYAWDGAPYDIYTKTARDGLPAEDWETEVYFPVRKT